VAIGREPGRALERIDPNKVAARALEGLAERQSSWRPAEVVRELAAATPTDLAADARDVVAWLDGLADGLTVERLVDLSRPVPADAVRRRDGRPVTESALDRALTTAAILDQEERLLCWAERRLTSAGGGGLIAVPAGLSGPEGATPNTGRPAARRAATPGRRAVVLPVPAGPTARTDHALVLIDGPVDGRAIYVPLTRGRHGNHAYVVTDGDQHPADVLAPALTREWVDQPAIDRRAELNQPAQLREHRPEVELGPRALRQLLERQYAIDQDLARRRVDHQSAVGALHQARLRQRQLEQAIVEANQRIEWQRERITDLDRPLRRRRHRNELDSARKVIAQAERTTADSQTEFASLEERLPGLFGRTLETARRAQDTAALEEERAAIAERLSADRATRAGRLAANPPELLVRELGERPDDDAAARAWDDAVGRISQHRTAHGITDPDHLLGPRPSRGDEPALTSYQLARQAIEGHERHLERAVGSRGFELGR
jgi:hypothetical protein